MRENYRLGFLNTRLLLAAVITFLALAFVNSKAFALSEYGLRCEDNKKCVECSKDNKCVKCMHKCWNFFGYADTDIKSGHTRTAEENCQLKRAKWCNAQCWDPDDVKEPDYITTKPSCDKKQFYVPEGGVKFQQNRQAF